MLEKIVYKGHHIHHSKHDFPCIYCFYPLRRPEHIALRRDATQTYEFFKSQTVDLVGSHGLFIQYDWADISYGLHQSVEVLIIVVYANPAVFNLPRYDSYYIYLQEDGRQAHTYREVMTCFLDMLGRAPFAQCIDDATFIAIQSDGGNHFKCAPMIIFYYYLKALIFPNKQISVHFKESHHGIGPYDRAGAEIQNKIKYEQMNNGRPFANNIQLWQWLDDNIDHMYIDFVPVAPVTRMPYTAMNHIMALHHFWYDDREQVVGTRYLDDNAPNQVTYFYAINDNSRQWLENVFGNLFHIDH